MGYFTYRIFKRVSLRRLRRQVQANLDLYKRGTVGTKIQVQLLTGDRCSAILMGMYNHEDMVFWTVGPQLGCIWMDVRYQDGDVWDLTIYEGAEHKVTHSVNPWAYQLKVEYVPRHIKFRINRVCELWPEQADRIRRYLLPWRKPVSKLGRTRFIPRKGKAYKTDQFGYGNAEQISDFVAAFGLGAQSRWETVTGGRRRRSEK